MRESLKDVQKVTDRIVDVIVVDDSSFSSSSSSIFIIPERKMVVQQMVSQRTLTSTWSQTNIIAIIRKSQDFSLEVSGQKCQTLCLFAPVAAVSWTCNTKGPHVGAGCGVRVKNATVYKKWDRKSYSLVFVVVSQKNNNVCCTSFGILTCCVRLPPQFDTAKEKGSTWRKYKKEKRSAWRK